jgi:hypothetical protein
MTQGEVMTYTISGLFFQDRHDLNIAYRAQIGTCVVMNKTLGQYMFVGAFWHDGIKLAGFIQDAFGFADISKIIITESEVSFEKIYEGRTDVIKYRFTRRVDETWAGEYNGELTGNGVASCLLMEVPATFFDPGSMMKLLGKNQPFIPPPGHDRFPDTVD